MACFRNEDDDMLENLKYLEYFEKVERRPAKFVFPKKNDYEELDDIDFIRRYRLSKKNVRYLLHRIGIHLQPATANRYSMTPLQQILVALRFYATGSFQLVLGDLNNLSQSSSCRAITKVSSCIAHLCQEFIQMPKTEVERKEISQAFYHMSGFPSVLGAVDCTHIPITSPGGENGEIFRNRKGYFSINVQTISDSKLLFKNIVARWPGSTHDSTIFCNSHICAMLEAGEVPTKYHLLGDSGYGCKLYLMTPILNPHTEQEMRYNRSHIKARNCVERQYGLWKRRFPCLSVGLRCNVQNAMNVIIATAVLHNIAILNEDTNMFDESETDDSYQNDVPVPIINSQNTAGFAKRNAIIRDFFIS